MLNKIDDGFNADLVTDAFFEGTLEIPCIEKPKDIIIPPALIPFTQRRRSETKEEFVHFYEHDIRFGDVINNAQNYVEELSEFGGIISPDCSLYRDMPLALQIADTYLNRAVGYYFQSQGLYVIPNIRWGDERSYSSSTFPEKFAFLGVDKHSIVSISTYGCIRGKENKYYFTEGLAAMLDELEPEVVLVYGSMPESVFGQFRSRTHFVNYPDWISTKRRRSA